MPEISVPITDEDLAGRINAAMLEALNDQVRNDLVRRAVEALTKTDKSLYGGNKSALQTAFDSAVTRMASEALANDPELKAAVEAEIRHLVEATVREGLADNDLFRRKVMEALTSVFSQERW